MNGPWIHGEPPTKGGRPKTVADALVMTKEQLKELPCHMFNTVMKARKTWQELDDDAFLGPRKVLWIWGYSGVGKSRSVKALEPRPYMKGQNKWWDLYNDEEIVLVDDFHPSRMLPLATHLKLWADPFGPISAEVKGSMRWMKYKIFIVTSQYSLEKCCEGTDSETLEAMKRRFNVIQLIAEDQIWPLVPGQIKYRKNWLNEYLEEMIVP